MTKEKEEILKIIERVSTLTVDIENYITSVKDWYYYFAENYSFLKFLEEYGEHAEELVDIRVTGFCNGNASVNVQYNDYSLGNIHYLDKTIYLPDFEMNVRKRLEKYRDDVFGYHIEECRQKISYYEKVLSEEKQKLEEYMQRQKIKEN